MYPYDVKDWLNQKYYVYIVRDVCYNVTKRDGGDYMASYEYNKKYADKYLGKLDELKVRLPGGRKATVEALATTRGLSVNGLINTLLREAAGLTEEEWKRVAE